jgi:fucose 4-O-acetylase-like acetyltransferase
MKQEVKRGKKRILFVDIAKGIAIILMILGHVVEHGVVRNAIFSFHMPLFLITSGFFYKNRTFKDELKNVFLRLLLPTFVVLFVVNLISGLNTKDLFTAFFNAVKVILGGSTHSTKIVFDFGSVGVCWFIYLLVGVRLLFNINKKIAKDNDLLLGLIVLVETLAGYLLGINGYWMAWVVDIALVGIVFYFAGYILNKYNILKKICSSKISLLLLLVIWVVGIKYAPIELAIRSYPCGFWCIIVAIAGSITVLKISMLIEKYLKYSAKVLAWAGKNSLYILYGHYVEEVLLISPNYPAVSMKMLKILETLFKLTFSILFAVLVLGYGKLKTKLLKQPQCNKK